MQYTSHYATLNIAPIVKFVKLQITKKVLAGYTHEHLP
jgi:hypothetical protein